MTSTSPPGESAQSYLAMTADLIDLSITVFRLDEPDDPCSLVITWQNARSRRFTRGSRLGGRLVDVDPNWAPDGSRGELLVHIADAAAKGVAYPSRLIEHVNLDGVEQVLSFTVGPLPDQHCVVVITDVTELAKARSELERLAYFDPLTGLPNRERLRELLAATPIGSTLFVLDLDGFTAVNEAFGHGCGDQMLVEVARVLAESPEGSVVARLAGDEFAILAGPQVARADEIAQRVFRGLSHPVQLPNGLVLQAPVSMGVTTKMREGVSADELLRQADVALHRAKQRRCGHEVYDARVDSSAPHRLILLGELRRALTAGELELHHQPLFDPATGRITSVESLLEWRHPSLGIIACDVLAELVEASNLAAEIVLHSLREALEHHSTWADAGVHLPLTIDIDARSVHDRVVVDTIIELVRSAGLPAHTIGLEIDERQLDPGDDTAYEPLARLRQAGVWVTFDHFGSGRTPIVAVRALRADALKIDRQLVDELRAADEQLVTALRASATRLGLLIGAEGVDDETTARWLVDHGVDRLQGPYLCEPLTSDGLLAFARSYRPSPVC